MEGLRPPRAELRIMNVEANVTELWLELHGQDVMGLRLLRGTASKLRKTKETDVFAYAIVRGFKSNVQSRSRTLLT